MSVPKLRFPEFAGAWHQTRLGKRVTKVGSGITPKGGAGVYQSEGIPLIRSQNVRDSMLDLSNVAFISDEINATMRGSAVLPNDVLLNITGASIGRSCVTPENLGPANVNQHVCIIRLDADASPHFLQSFLASHKGQKLIAEAQSGSGREGLNFENIRTFKLIFPTLPEQQKIAAFLGAVDAKLAALTAKRAALGRFKAGLMQKLFSQQLRFTRDDGQAFPDWQKKELRAVSTINPKSPNLPKRFRYIDLESVSAGTLGAVREIDATEAPSRAQRVLQHGDIIYQMVRPYQRNNLYFDLDGVYVGSTGYAQIRAKQNRHYLFQVLHTDEFVNRVLELCTGTGYPAINSNDLGKATIPLPHPDEQQKIADALSAMDAKIQAVADQVSKLQAFKKGLLQQMFV